MKKAILISGIAGSGKSTICRELIKQGYEAYDIEDMPRLFTVVHKSTGQVSDSYDNGSLEYVEQYDWVCDKNKLAELINSQKEPVAYYCGIASNIDEILPLFSQFIIITTSPETIRARLSARKKGEYGHAKEVRDWTLKWKDWWENEMKKKGAKLVNANQTPEAIVKEILITI
ncbi:MAG TPA: AAA family ATPase [Candidatus Saccharimonadales bacterium]|nr:AAA family ATPase [Candidatus Saccharimonadales bacterium]